MSAVQLCPWTPAWAAEAAALAAELTQALGAAVEPIGSTAVEGLCAKTVLDLMLGLPRLDALGPPQHAALAALGFVYRPEHEAELPQRRYFVRAATPGRLRVHLHALEQDGLLWRRHRGFRDALRADAALRARYQALKQDLCARHAHDKAAYQAAKAPFIGATLRALGL